MHFQKVVFERAVDLYIFDRKKYDYLVPKKKELIKYPESSFKGYKYVMYEDYSIHVRVFLDITRFELPFIDVAEEYASASTKSWESLLDMAYDKFKLKR